MSNCSALEATGTGARHTARLTAIFVASVLLCFTVGCKHDPKVQRRKYFESGMRYENEGKLKAAVIQFQNALKVDKTYADAHYELAKIYPKLGEMNLAYAELMRTVDLAPTNLKARLDLGNLLLLGGKTDRATEQANAVLAAQADNAGAFALMSNISAMKGDRPQALTYIQHALALEPNNANFHGSLGVLQSSDPSTQDAAIGELEKSVSINGDNASAHIALARLLEKKGDMQGAEKEHLAAIKAAPLSMQARITLVALYLHTGDKAKAEETLRKATEDLSDTHDGASLLENYYRATGQIDKAESAYATLVNDHPKSFPLKMAYARILVSESKFDKANAVAKELTKTNEGDPQVAALNGTLLLQAGKTDEAFTLLQKATKASPDNVPLKVLYGLAARGKGDMVLAETNFHDAATRDPRNLNAQRALADMLARKGDSGQLRQVAETTMKFYPDLPDPYLWRGTAEEMDKHFDEASADLQTVLKKDPKDSRALYELGYVRIRQQKVPEGKALLEQALQAGPNQRALQLLVMVDLQTNKGAEALSRIQQQIALAPTNGELYSQLAMVQLALKDPKSAVDSATKAMQLNPADPSAVRAYTQAELSAGNPGAASAKWEQWGQSHPKDPEAPSMLGMLAEAAGQQQKAMDYYKKALMLQPEQAMASNNLAFLMVENNQNLDVALTLAQSAHRSLPNSASTSDTLAWVYYHKGVYESARDLLEDAVKEEPQNASIEYHLGMTYSRLGDKSKSAAHLKKAAQLAPDSPSGKSASQELARLG